MSTFTERAAILQRADLSPWARLLALRILDMQGLSKGACLLPTSTLAADLGCSERTVKRASSELREAGLLDVKASCARRRITIGGGDSPGTPGVTDTAPPEDAEGVTPMAPGGDTDGTPGVTRVAPREREGAREENERSSSPLPPTADEPAPKPEHGPAIAELEGRYPAGLMARVREGCALARRNGRMADSLWLTTLRKLEAHDVAAVVSACEVYLDRYADGDKAEGYLLGIVRREARRGPSSQRGSARLPPAVITDAEAAESARRVDAILGPSTRDDGAEVLSLFGRVHHG